MVLAIKDPQSKDETLMVNYTGLIPLITSAIQEQQRMIQSSNAGYQTIQSEVESIKTKLEQVKVMVEKLTK